MPKLLVFSRLCLYYLVFLMVVLVRANAQTDHASGKGGNYPIANQFEHLSVEDGLSNDHITAILQDRDGYMWFGTGNGLNKYDGSRFTIFKPDLSQPTRSFQNGFVMGLCEGDSTRIWAATKGGGLHEVNRKTGQVIPHPIQAVHANRWNNQLSVYQDRQHRIWVSTFAGLARYDPAQHQFTLYPSPGADVPIITVFEDRQHRFWVASHQGLYLFDRSTGRYTLVPVSGWDGPQPSFQSFYLDADDVLWLGTATAGYSLFKLDLRQKNGLPVPYNPGGQLNPYVFRNTIHRDTAGIIWVGTTSGLQGIDPVKNQIYTYRTDPNRPRGLCSSSAQAIYHDRSGMFWIGTDNGIDRQALNTKPFASYQVKPNERMASMPENRAYAVFRDKRGQLWFNNSPTLYRLSADQKQLDKIPPGDIGSTGQHGNEVTAFLPDGKGGIWLGSYDGLIHHDPASGKFTRYPSEVPAQFMSIQDKDGSPRGDVWIGGDGGFASFNPRTRQYTYHKYQPGNPEGLPDKYVYGMLVSRTGEIWILVHRLGVCRLNPKTGRMTRYSAGAKGHLTSNDVRCIYEDQDGVIWIGTNLGGLNRFDEKTNQFSAITHQEGIPGSTIVAISGDESGNLWLSTHDGLCRVNPRTKAIRTYRVSDGLPSNNFKQNAVFRYGNQLIFGSENGIVQFAPDQIREDLRPFPVHITGLTVLDEPRPLTDELIRLKHDENRLSIDFAALAYEQPRQNQFAYRLDGIDKDWIQNGNRNTVNFTSLPPGSYTFRVKAANSNGLWSKHEAFLQFVVQPPWWASWWAYGLYLLLTGGAIWGYIRFSTNRIRQRQELELNRREAEQLKAVDELKTRFFSNITHEFRTPLSLIIAPVEKLMQEGRFDGPTLTLVHRNAQQLLRLINQLLDLAKLEGHHMAVAPVQGQVTDFIEPIVAIFQRAAEHKGITFTFNPSPFPATEFVFDADKWEKILTNLLANALKFTKAGGRVNLSVAPVSQGDQMTGVQFQVTDSGIGIAPEHLPHIFDRFYQVDTSTTRAHEGTGLGLALAHELIQLLGGDIAVESRVGVGTTFRWTLPVGPVSQSVALPPISNFRPGPTVVQPLLSPPSGSVTDWLSAQQPAPCILIVEDNDELREFLVGELASKYHIVQAVDGQQGWEIAQTELPDIILTDVMMPRLDGHALCRLIKGHAETDHIAVVMLTAKAAQPSRLEGLQHGADEYLSKPFSMAELKLRIQNLLSRQEKLGEHYRQQFSLPSSTNGTVTPADSSDSIIPDDSTDPFLARIYALLEQHLDEPSLSVEWLADQLAMNRKTLYRKVQSIIQLPPAELIRRYRIRKGVELLRAGYNVAETADRVGFSTPSHFTMVFKEIYQQTPTEFTASRSKTP
ncbi:two-component regulator propeller domain-containing protein [Larkinella insperata]|uniref:histidine kinase n=1 Tax=Larkinella insperata TaxID=332158 RepID=A0ABW3QEF0_9BACT